MSKKCELCHKEVFFPLRECDDSGLIWHCVCFCCSVCGVILNEKDFNLRENNKLFCKTHAFTQPGYQPVCKCYGMFRSYRIVF